MALSAPDLHAVVQTSCQEDVPIEGVWRNIRDPVCVADQRLQSLLGLHIGDEAVKILPCTDQGGRRAIKGQRSHRQVVVCLALNQTKVKKKEFKTKLLTGKAGFKLASLHVVQEDASVDISSCGELPISRVGNRVEKFLAHCKFFSVFGES